MTEHELIGRLVAGLPRHPAQRNETFTCDAELLEIGGRTWAVTVDDFSPAEDLFTDDDPELLGANLATATLSDLLACGADPTFLLAALSLPPDVGADFVDGLRAGVASVLSETGCCLAGGDLGSGETWRFCGVGLGPIAGERALTRVIPPAPHSLWVTGWLGDANLAALLGTPTPRFEVRWREARVVRAVASACIDTSGGLLDALWCLASVSPGMGLEVDLERVPLAAGLAELHRVRGIPLSAALVAGAGEYELLFAVPSDVPESARHELRALGATSIGTASPSAAPGLTVCRAGSTPRSVAEPPPCARAAGEVAEHIRQVIAYARDLEGGE